MSQVTTIVLILVFILAAVLLFAWYWTHRVNKVLKDEAVAQGELQGRRVVEA